ncbi:hypothetical protein ACFL3E_00540 [Patescibacteria group bacterium]
MKISSAQLRFLISALFVMALWIFFVEYMASTEAIRFITKYNIDKLFHFIGGAFLASLLFWILGRQKLLFLILYIIVISILWEVAELLLDPLTVVFFEKSKELWLRDSMLDAVAASVGALFYWHRPIL